LCGVWNIVEWAVWIGAAMSLFTFLVPQLIQAYLFKEQDLKKKYGAKWALVTGGSSGIGRAITEKLAKQNINVVIVALDDTVLREFHEKIQKEFPNLQFRAVGVDLGGADYLERIIENTNDIDICLLFNNAGFITIGLFSDLSLERQLKNYNVNATSAIRITHHFLNLMISKKLKGVITFTSSPAGLMPCPFSAMYGATKAFLTEFGVSLAGEVKHDGIDVMVMHPSPVDTAFYNADTAHKRLVRNVPQDCDSTHGDSRCYLCKCWDMDSCKRPRLFLYHSSFALQTCGWQFLGHYYYGHVSCQW